jgi:signal transduction histidine kinase
MSFDRRRLTFEVVDDGRGFEPGAADLGHGLASMRARAKTIGGVLEISAAPGSGTRLRLEVPVRRHAWRFLLTTPPRE